MFNEQVFKTYSTYSSETTGKNKKAKPYTTGLRIQLDHDKALRFARFNGLRFVRVDKENNIIKEWL